MEFKNTIFAILAIFCVVLSACAVSATGDLNANDGQAIHDSMILPPDYAHDEAAMLNATNSTNTTNVTGHAAGEDIHNSMILPPDYAHSEAQKAAGEDVNGQDTHDSMILPPDYAHDEAAMMNATGHAAGENTANATHNATASAHTMPATGNPILALLAVGAVLGGACVLRRK